MQDTSITITKWNSLPDQEKMHWIEEQSNEKLSAALVWMHDLANQAIYYRTLLSTAPYSEEIYETQVNLFTGIKDMEKHIVRALESRKLQERTV